MLKDLIGWPIYEVLEAAASLQKDLRIVKEDGVREKFFKSKGSINVEVEEGKVVAIWEEQ